MFSSNLTEFHGLPVFDFPMEDPGPQAGPLPGADAVAWRFRWDYDNDTETALVWPRFLETVDTTRVRALVIGQWQEVLDEGADEILQLVVGAADRLPALTGFFFGDVTREESEVSWIEQTNLAPLLEAFPGLVELGARGSHTRFGPVRHAALRSLVLESGGMSAAVTRDLSQCELPALERLHLFLGSENYGGDTSVEDLTVLLSGTRFPALRDLGLMNSEAQDRIAAAVAQAPVVPMLERLSLALGILTDEGAESLLNGQPLTHLTRLDLHHHFLSDAMTDRIRAALEPAGVEVDLSEQCTPNEYDGRVWHYIAVSE